MAERETIETTPGSMEIVEQVREMWWMPPVSLGTRIAHFEASEPVELPDGRLVISWTQTQT